MELQIWQPLDHFIPICVDIPKNQSCFKKITIPLTLKIIIHNALTKTFFREPTIKSKNLDQNA
jgi:hypothetical protein